MSLIEIILVIIVVLIIIKLLSLLYSWNIDIDNVKKEVPAESILNDDAIDNVSEKSNKETRSMKVNRSVYPKKELLNPYVNNIQFHTDYRDILTAFGNLVPSQKQLFNIANIPVTVTHNVRQDTDLKYMIHDFMDTLNDEVATEKSWYRGANTGWDEALPDPHMESGWDRQQKALGLPASLYEEPKRPSKVKLVKVLKITKYESDSEIKYTILLVIQKLNVSDQMILQASFIQNKLSEDCKDNNGKFQRQLIIEELTVIGFLSNYGEDNDQYKAHNNFYNFDSLEHTQMIDDKKIAAELLKKYQEKTDEVDYRISMLNNEDREHYNIPNLSNYDSYKVTTTIFDDMKGKNCY